MTAPDIWIQTGSGRAFDLLQPRAEMVDFDIDIAESLARIPRFTGHIRSGGYSVAQHSVMGADALWRETGRTDLAAAFLLHDGHEGIIGDISTPVAEALIHLGGPPAEQALKHLKRTIDAAIHGAAGVSYPLTAEIAAAVKTMDIRMLATERRHLLGPSPYPWRPIFEAARPIRLVGKFRVWPWPEAADEFRARLATYLPARSKKRNAA